MAYNNAQKLSRREMLNAMKDLKFKAPEEFVQFMRVVSASLDLEFKRLLDAGPEFIFGQQARTKLYYELMQELDNCQQWSADAEHLNQQMKTATENRNKQKALIS